MTRPLDAKIADENVQFVSEAVESGYGSNKFDAARKIFALAKVLGEDVVSAEAAAKQADAAMFAKAMAYKAGNGEITDEDAAEAVADRNASGFVSVARSMIAEVVETGCETVGVAIGSMLGSPTIGYAVGAAVGHFLNAPVGEIVARGARKVVHYATRAWQTAKRAVGSFVNKVTDWLFS